MTQIAVIDPATREYRLYPEFKADGTTPFLGVDDFPDCTRVEVDDAFTWVGKGIDWETDPPSIVDDNSQFLDALRKRRDLLLLATDQTQIREDFSHEERAAWSTYRSELRAWPDMETDPENPTEPVPPDADTLASMVAIIERLRTL